MMHNNYEPKVSKEISQQSRRDNTFEENLLASNKLLEKQI